MTIYRAQMVFPYFSGNARDVIVNGFHFEGIAADLAAAATIIDVRLNAFYKTFYPTAGTNRVNYVDWEQAYLKVFDLSDTSPRIPEIKDNFWSTPGLNGSPVPTEVATVLSWKAAPESGTIYQRLYNRIYIGAMPSFSMDISTASAFPFLDPTWVSDIAGAADDMLVANDGTMAWVQYSEAGGVPIARDIVGGWVDNGPDSQRRRSVDAALRTNWVATP